MLRTRIVLLAQQRQRVLPTYVDDRGHTPTGRCATSSSSSSAYTSASVTRLWRRGGFDFDQHANQFLKASFDRLWKLPPR